MFAFISSHFNYTDSSGTIVYFKREFHLEEYDTKSALRCTILSVKSLHVELC